MAHDLMYIELKTGYSDDGPAWIGYVKASKSGKTLYFNDHAFQKCRGTYSNYRDIESGEAYWISGLKKRETAIGPDMEKLPWTGALSVNISA